MAIAQNIAKALTSFITATGTHERAILIGGQAIRDWHAAQLHALTGTAMTLPVPMTLSAMVQGMAEKAVDKKHGYQEWMDPHMWQVSRPDVFSATRRLFFAVLVDPRAAIDNLVELAQGEADWIATGARRRRPGRSFKRETKRPWGRWA